MTVEQDLAVLGQISAKPRWKPAAAPVDHNRVLSFLGDSGAAPSFGDPSLTRGAAERPGGGGGDGNLLKQAGGFVGNAFMDVINTVDKPRAMVVSGINEIWDAFDDGDASWSEFNEQWKRNMSFSELMENKDAFQDWHPLVRGGIGFIGDIASDPLTYLTAGTLKAATIAGKGLKPGEAAMDLAIAGGRRADMARTVVEQAALARAAGKEITEDELGRLVGAVGTRGRGGVTRKGLREAGVRPDILGDLNVKHNVAFFEPYQNFKGSLKKTIGASRAAKVSRKLFSGSSDPLGQAVRRFTDDVLSGAGNRLQAATGLVAIREGARNSYQWGDELVNSANRGRLRELSKLSKAERGQLAHAAEIGDRDAFDGLSGEILDWFERVGVELQEAGVEFGWVDNYVNHILTDKGMRMLEDPNSTLSRLAGDTFSSKEVFQKTRSLRQGEKFLNQEIPVVTAAGDYATVQQLNDISRRVLNVDIFEEDIDMMMNAYIRQATQAKYKIETANALRRYGYGVNDEVADLVRSTDQAVQAQKRAMDASSGLRKANLEFANQQIDAKRVELTDGLKRVEREIQAAYDRVLSAESRVKDLDGRLRSLEQTRLFWQNILDSKVGKARNVRRAEKAQATKELNKINKEFIELAEKKAAADDALIKAKSARKRYSHLKAEADKLGSQLDELGEDAKALAEARQALDSAELPDVPDMAAVQARLDAALEQQAAVRRAFMNADNEFDELGSTLGYVVAEPITVHAKLSNKLDDFTALKGVAEDTKRSVRDRVNVLMESFAADDDLSAAAQIVRNVEAQSVMYDLMGAGHAQTVAQGRQAIEAMVGVMDDKRFQKYMETVLDDGFHMINSKVGVPQWFEDATARIPRGTEDWAAARKTLAAYDKGLNWWKGWAVTSPGFVVRNVYSGMFNMYLDGVRAENVRKFNKFMSKYLELSKDRAGRLTADQNTLDEALKWAAGNGWPTELDQARLRGALEAASISGWGLNPEEITSRMVGNKGSFNPFNVEFGPTRFVRNLSGQAEARMRASHAYDVLMRGGSVSQAADRVQMFHFNYRDITDFDRAMKRVIPFWTFYSRNMALQAQVWTRWPQKLNRSYFNFKRNMEYQSEQDDVVPSYYDELSAVKMPFKLPGWVGGDGESSVYFTPDIPSLRFRQDFAQLTPGALGGEFDPLRILSDTSPAIKVPVEMVANKELFTDQPFKNRLYDYNDEGPTPRSAPHLLQLPGVKQVANLLPGTDIVGGNLVMQDNTQSAIEDFLPALARSERLVPNTDKYRDRFGQSWMSFLGGPFRELTPGAVQGELYRQRLELEAQRKEARDRALIESLLP